MKRWVTLPLGVLAVLMGGLLLSPGDAKASGGEDGRSDDEVEKKLEHRVFVLGGGSGAFLGVGLEDPEDADTRGALVRSVEEGGPAEEAGIREGDLIVRFDGESVRSASHLARLVRETPAGRSVPLEVTRGGASRTVTAKLDEKKARWGHLGGEGGVVVPDMDFDITVPEPFPPHAPGAPLVGPGPHVFRWKGPGDADFATPWIAPGPMRLGVRYMELSDQLAAYFGVEPDEGVLVTSVEEDSPAQAAGLRAGDVILEFDGQAIGRGRDLQERVQGAEGGEAVTVKVKRQGKPLDLKVTLAERERPRSRGAGVSL